MSPLRSTFLAALLIAGGAPAHQDVAVPEAPDGHPGLGVVRTSREYSRVFLSPTPEESELLQSLSDLDSDVRVLAEMARRTYRERGYFELIDRFGPQEVSDLHAGFLAQQGQALTLIAKSSPVAEAWIDMFLDLRFRARMPLLEAFREEAREVEAGLALLRGLQDGYVELKDSEARAIAERVDLAASLLRAIRLDLEVLVERGDANAPGQPDPAWKFELIGIAKMRDDDERRAAFERLEAKVARRQAQFESVLFWPRLQKRLDKQLRRRDFGREKAREHLAEVKFFLLELDQGVIPPPELLRMQKYQRHQFALSEALLGIGLDPFNEDLAFRAGIATDLLYETHESRQWFDRFLALRGIRLHLYQTTERDLDEEEQHALLVLMRGGVVPGR